MPQSAKLPAVLAVAAAMALASCSGKPAATVSAAGRQVCKERQADLPPETSADSLREAFRTCLKTVDAELARQQLQDQAQRSSEAQQQALEAERLQVSLPSASERYGYCLQVQSQVQEAERLRIRTLGPAMVAARTYGAQSPEARAAEGNVQEAITTLERLIPAEMRRGRTLIPDAVEMFRRCDPADFSQG